MHAQHFMNTRNDPKPSQLPRNACPACACEQAKVFALTSDIAHETSDETFEYLRCSRCSTIFINHPPVPEKMGRFYPEQYDQHVFSLDTESQGRLDRLAEKFHAKICCRYPFFKLRQNFFNRMSPDDLFLDYGCGAGEALNQARARGAQTVGVDFVDALLDELNKQGHRGLSATSDWASDVLALGGASKIRLNHSLEHVHDPRSLLKQIAATANPGCRLQLSVPNPQGLSATLFGRSWWGLEAPRHLVLVSAKQICSFLEEVGFKVTDVCTEPTGKDIARSFGLAGWRHSLLRDKNVARNLHRNGLALMLGLPLGMAAAMAGRGDRLHIYAERA